MAAPELNRSHRIQIPFDPRQPWIWSVSFQEMVFCLRGSLHTLRLLLKTSLHIYLLLISGRFLFDRLYQWKGFAKVLGQCRR